MEHITLLVAVLVFWFFVHVRRRVLTSDLNLSLLPLTSPSHTVSRPLLMLGHQTRIDLPSHFVLRGETTLFSAAHAHFVEFLREPRRKSRRDILCSNNWLWGRAVRAFYDVGSVIAILGQLLSVGVLLWSLFRLAILFLSALTPVHDVTKQLVKRGPVPSSLPLPQNELPLKPLIPGLTLPLSHLPHILASLIVCTAIHELGHAIAAAADGIPLISWGYSLIFVVPAAFVQLSTVTTMKLERNSPRRRLRISSAGSYHNLITLMVLFHASALSFDQTVWALLGYRSPGAGVVVIDIQKDSPLASHLISGSVITGIDDTVLSGMSNHSAQDMWSKLLLDTVDTGDPEGWCIERDGFDGMLSSKDIRFLLTRSHHRGRFVIYGSPGHSHSCCISVSRHQQQHEMGSCFLPLSQSLPVGGIGRCIDPLSLFEGGAVKRCTSDAACNLYATGYDSFPADTRLDINTDASAPDRPQTYTCVVADESAMLLRIYFHGARSSDVDGEKMVVWRGPRREIWEQVTIGEYLPRARFLPLGLPNMMKLLLEYLRTVSLSLFFFNLLPVRVLDGGEILSVLVELLLRPRALRQSDNIPLANGGDLEIGRSDWPMESASWARRARKVERIVEKATVALVGIVFLGAVFVVGVG